ncbi:MAG: cell division protein FtsQ/DivIB [Solirubrobacterales bacterium]
MSLAGAIDLSRGRAAMRDLPRSNFAAVKRFRPTRKGVVISLLVALLLAVPAWLLVRNSSLVAVEQVRVVGLGGYYDRQARAAVVAEAKGMTTMNVDEQALAQAAGSYVSVEGVTVNSDFPHKLTIYVDVRRPVAAARVGDEMVGLTGNGLVLASSTSLSHLPVIEVSGPLKSGHITDQKALAAATVLGAAPDVLLRQVKSVKWGRNGLMIVLDKGVELYFGDATRTGAKWRAVSAVLADPAAHGASYIDLRAPSRPAIGGLGAAPTTVGASSLSEVTAATTTADPAATTPGTQTATPQQTPAAQPQQTPVTPQPQQPAGGAVAPPSGQ